MCRSPVCDSKLLYLTGVPVSCAYLMQPFPSFTTCYYSYCLFVDAEDWASCIDNVILIISATSQYIFTCDECAAGTIQYKQYISTAASACSASAISATNDQPRTAAVWLLDPSIHFCHYGWWWHRTGQQHYISYCCCAVIRKHRNMWKLCGDLWDTC